MTTVIPIATCNVTGGSVTTIGAVTDAVTGLPLASVVGIAAPFASSVVAVMVYVPSGIPGNTAVNGVPVAMTGLPNGLPAESAKETWTCDGPGVPGTKVMAFVAIVAVTVCVGLVMIIPSG